MSNVRPTAQELIAIYGLQAHPEGGYYRESYRSPKGVAGQMRACSTAIYFLIPAGSKSRFHRLKSDEVWHFYLGGPMTLVEIHPDGRIQKGVLGTDVRSGQEVQHVVPAGCWFGGVPNTGVDYSFVGCTVAPGFEISDFELGRRQDLLAAFPHARREIEQLAGD